MVIGISVAGEQDGKQAVNSSDLICLRGSTKLLDPP